MSLGLEVLNRIDVEGDPVNWVDPWGLESVWDDFGSTAKTKALRSAGLALLTDMIACGLDPGPLRGAVNTLSALLSANSSAMAGIASATSFIFGGSTATTGVGAAAGYAGGMLFGGIAISEYLNAANAIEDALKDFRGEGDECLDKCERLRQLLN